MKLEIRNQKANPVSVIPSFRQHLHHDAAEEAFEAGVLDGGDDALGLVTVMRVKKFNAGLQTGL